MCYSVTARNFFSNCHNFLVKERYPKLQRICHTHFISFKQNIACHPHVQIKVLHFSNIVFIFDFIIKWLCNFSRIRSVCFNFQEFFSFFGSKHISVSDKSFFKVFAFSDKEIYSSVSRKLSGRCAYTSFNSSWKFVVKSTVRFAVYVISAENFICAFA